MTMKVAWRRSENFVVGEDLCRSGSQNADCVATTRLARFNRSVDGAIVCAWK